MLPALVLLTLAIFAGALAWSSQVDQAVWLHAMLAVGAMPLIFGAMAHFIPVLTRTRRAEPAISLIPLLALGGGMAAVMGVIRGGINWQWQAGAVLALASAAALLIWSRRRRRQMLGGAHPGLAWYEGALVCLAAALLALLVGALWPQHFLPLRRLHLHLNLLGFIGLTAMGTLTVLMPTATGRLDAGVGPRLWQDLPVALVGTLLIGLGAAWLPALAWMGLLAWVVVLARLWIGWLRLYHAEIFALHGAPPLLAMATVGFAFALAAGAALSSGGSLDPRAAFIGGVLLPLVSGAASQLLPVWLRPGMQGAWHRDMRKRLGRYNGIRALLFLLGAVAAALGHSWGLMLSAGTLLWFLLQAAASPLLARKGVLS